MDFKVRALDFLDIYVKQSANRSPEIQMKLIQGLLKGLTTAQNDNNTILFDRIKTVLASIAKQSSNSTEEHKASDGKECKMLLTEMMTMLLRTQKDQALSKAYADSFVVLTKLFWEDPSQKEFITFTYKELLKKLLSGRCNPQCGLTQKFVQHAFEQVPGLGWSLSKFLLSCFLAKEKDSEDGSRNNHQRLAAVEIFGGLIRASTSEEAHEDLAKQLPLLASVLVKVVQTSESWQKKKTQKTGQCVNLFTKACKQLMKSAHKNAIAEPGATLITALEAAVAKDPSMSNLKGKVKEIKHAIEH